MVIESQRVFHVIEAQGFDRGWLEGEFFPEAAKMRVAVDCRHQLSYLSGKTVCLLFYEPSTRTRVSFEQAAHMLGAKISSTENAREFSSVIKGESLIDTIRTINALGFDAVVLRSDYEGGAKDAAAVSNIPVINAGDGSGQHPTQALLDLETIYCQFGKLDGLRVALVGDLLRGRTIRSLAYLLGKFDHVYLDLVAPPQFQMRPDIIEYLDRHGIRYGKTHKLIDVVSAADVIYLTRLQTERIWWLKSLPKALRNFLSKRLLGSRDVSVSTEVMDLARDGSILMHPLPRSDGFDELPEKFTSDPRVVIFKQVEGGLYTRMALLNMVLT